VEQLVSEGLDLFYLRLRIGLERLSPRGLGVEVYHLRLQEVLLTFLFVSEFLPVFSLFLNGLSLLLGLFDLLLQCLQLGLILFLDLPGLELC
jgi:hypothetical protein